MAKNEHLTQDRVKQFLSSRVETIDLNSAKKDVFPFLRDPTQLEIWSVDFFRHWINQLTFDAPTLPQSRSFREG
jgi:hypothetical protein